MQWAKRPLPQIGQRANAKLTLRDFQLKVLGPLVGSFANELSGVLEGDVQVAITPEGTRLSGSAHLSDGAVQVPAIGQRFSEVSARVVVSDNSFQLEEFSARGATGRVKATGSARLDGFALREAALKATIAENEQLPITIEGAAIGDAWGTVKLSYSAPLSGARQLAIDVPRFTLITPDTAHRSLQSLDDDEGIRVGAHRADGAFVPLPVQPLETEDDAAEEGRPPLRIRVKLRNVTFERGSIATVQLVGELTVVLAEEMTVDGRIELRRGELDVQGKKFEIERGVITFDGKDPENPTITATARWDSPTDHAVFAEYSGDVENGKLTLRAEPPLTQDEIANLLMFGSTEGGGGVGETDESDVALAVAGGTAAQGLNQGISDLTNLDVTARVDQSTGSARPELVYQMSRRVAAKVSRALGEPTPGESLDRTFLTLELRLRRHWALSALLGDRGATALDLIWRRRY
jgi:translocation and assembly module TamB